MTEKSSKFLFFPSTTTTLTEQSEQTIYNYLLLNH